MLENTTDRDYTLAPENISIMEALPENKGLGPNSSVSLAESVFIPAKHKVKITIYKTIDYTDSFPVTSRDNLEKLTAFVGKRLEELAGFAIFDKASRFTINCPSGWDKKQKLTNVP
jgi:hypothetical protein